MELGAADETPESLAGAAEAEVVVLAPPVLAVRDLLARLAPHLTPGTVVTDVASTKRCVEAWAARFLPLGVAYIGGHPMAGKEQAGIEHADGRLFQGRTWCIVPPPGADPGAEEVVRRLAEDAGSRTVRLGARRARPRRGGRPATSPSSPRPSWPRRWSPGPSSPTWPRWPAAACGTPPAWPAATP